MERTAVNPWSWSVNLGFDQAQLVEGHRRELICSAQDAVDADGNHSIRATWRPSSGLRSTTSKLSSLAHVPPPLALQIGSLLDHSPHVLHDFGSTAQ
jgi:hypothetical protein